MLMFVARRSLALLTQLNELRLSHGWDHPATVELDQALDDHDRRHGYARRVDRAEPTAPKAPMRGRFPRRGRGRPQVR